MATQTGRLLSLDIMRGITIAGMILVNDPGSWQYVYTPLKHAAWNGLTPTDLVFPFFMFIMGVSMYLSLRKYNFTLTAESVRKIVKRTVLIFLVGYALNWFGHGCGYAQSLYADGSSLVESLWKGFTDFGHVRVLGVMQRLAIAYGVGSIIGLACSQKYILYLSGSILLAYAALLSLTNSTELHPGNLIAVLDNTLFGASRILSDTMADGTVVPFDPEGLLSALGSIAHVLLGFYCGMLIANAKKNNEVIIRNLFIFGTLLLFVGLLASYGCPINKRLWSSTFVLVTCGFGSLFLAILIWGVDIHHKKNWSLFFEAFGINPLYLYVQAGVVATLIGLSGFQSVVFTDVLAPLFGNYGGSLAWAILFVVANWIPGYYLYKKQIYIKL